MAQEFILVRKDQMQELLACINRMQELYSELAQGAGTLTLGNSAPPPPAPVNPAPQSTKIASQGGEQQAEGPGAADRQASEAAYLARKYRIVPGSFSYADVAWREIQDPEFELKDAWRRIEPLIYITSDRAFESFRRAMEKDERFQRIPERSGWWFRRARQRSVLEQMMGNHDNHDDAPE